MVHFDKDTHKHLIHVDHFKVLVNVHKAFRLHEIINFNRSWYSIFLLALLRSKDNDIVVLQVWNYSVQISKSINVLASLIPCHNKQTQVFLALSRFAFNYCRKTHFCWLTEEKQLCKVVLLVDGSKHESVLFKQTSRCVKNFEFYHFIFNLGSFEPYHISIVVYKYLRYVQSAFNILCNPKFNLLSDKLVGLWINLESGVEQSCKLLVALGYHYFKHYALGFLPMETCLLPLDEGWKFVFKRNTPHQQIWPLVVGAHSYWHLVNDVLLLRFKPI